MDLKYAKNVKGETFVALSMICAATNKHAAVLLKTRKPSYEWILVLEAYGIHSKTKGALMLAGKACFGGIPGSDPPGHGTHPCLVTRKGYSANMLVFGKNISFPEMLADDDYEPVTLAQAQDMDSEVMKRNRVRQKARQILLREDIQSKLRKALQKKPTDQSTTFSPGDVIYFFVPHPSKPRYRKDSGRWRGPGARNFLCHGEADVFSLPLLICAEEAEIRGGPRKTWKNLKGTSKKGQKIPSIMKMPPTCCHLRMWYQRHPR